MSATVRYITFPLFAGDAGRERAFANVASADLELVDHRVLDGRCSWSSTDRPARTAREPEHPNRTVPLEGGRRGAHPWSSLPGT